MNVVPARTRVALGRRADDGPSRGADIERSSAIAGHHRRALGRRRQAASFESSTSAGPPVTT
jgi:hypothetical protein